MSVPVPSPARPPSADLDVDPARPAARSRAPRPVAEPGAVRRPARTPVVGYAHIVWARLVGLGGLTAVIAAVVYLIATAGGTATPPLDPLAAPLAAHKARYWIVRPGQTLSSIAGREHVAVTEVERLNPGLIPGSLASGQRVKLPG